MPRLHDMKCRECSTVEHDVILRGASDVKPCVNPECPGTMHITWEFSSGRIGSYDGFKPFDLEGVHYGTKEQWDTRRNQIARNLGEEPGNIQIVTNADKHARADDAMQRHEDNLKRRGMDPQQWRERQEYAKHHR